MKCWYHFHWVTINNINQLIEILVDANNTIHYDRHHQGQLRLLPGSQVNAQEPATTRPSMSSLRKHREVIVVVDRLPLVNTPHYCLCSQSHTLWGEGISTVYEKEVTRSEPYLIMLICRHNKCDICMQAAFEGDAHHMEGAHSMIPFALSWM